jgi:hypothetical protein
MAHIVAAAAVPSRHVAPMEKDYLILKRASASRPSGEWNEDDFDVMADGVVVGRIFKANASPVGASWMWALAFGHPPVGSTAVHEGAVLGVGASLMIVPRPMPFQGVASHGSGLGFVAGTLRVADPARAPTPRVVVGRGSPAPSPRDSNQFHLAKSSDQLRCWCKCCRNRQFFRHSDCRLCPR